MSERACISGWIIQDGIIVDRCMVCNEPPWYRKRRRERFIARFWPLIFVVSLAAIQFGLGWAIVLFQRAFR